MFSSSRYTLTLQPFRTKTETSDTPLCKRGFTYFLPPPFSDPDKDTLGLKETVDG